MTYVIVFIFVLFLNFIKKNNKFSNKLCVAIVGLVLVSLASLRYGVGTDWEAYHDFYVYGVDNVEIGYATVNNFFSNQDFPYILFLLIINLFSICLISKSSYRHSLIPVLSLLIYYSDLYLYFNFSGVRQALAISITLYALKYSYGDKRNIYFYSGLILCATSFHISSIIFLLAYFIPQRKLRKKELIIILFSFMFFSTLVYYLSTLLTGVFASKAEFYLEHQEQAVNINNLFVIGLLRRSITILLVLFFGRKFIFKDNLSAYLFNLYVIGFGIFASCYLISPDIGVRMSVYFTVIEMYLLANLISLTKRIDVKAIIYLLVLVVCLYKIYTYIEIPAYEYKTIF